MMVQVLILLVGFFLLVKGADWFVEGAASIAKKLGISRKEIIACGDGYNDYPLLMAAGLKVAMGNAISDLKEIADYIAPPVQKDGVADVIEKFILEK